MSKRALAATAVLCLVGLAGPIDAAGAATPFPAPTDLTGQVADQRAVLDWAAVPRARDYLVYDITSRPEGRLVGITRDTSWASPRLRPSTTGYSYVIAARGSTKTPGVRTQPVHVLPGEQPTEPPPPSVEPTEPPPPTDPGMPDELVAQPTRVWAYEPGGDLTPPWSEVHSPRGNRQGITTENPYPGTDASAEFTVRPGETGWNGTVGTLRSEVRDSVANSGNVGEGDEQWWAWPTFFPADFDWDERNQFLVVTQWHQTANSGNPNVAIRSDVDEDMILEVRGGSGGRTPGDAEFEASYDLGPIDRGEWDSLMVHFVWSSDPDVGLTEIYRDGRLVVRARGANLYEGQSVYIKQGIYSAAGTRREHMVRHSTLRLGDTRESVETLPPRR